MTDTTPAGPPSIAEIAALTARLRTLSRAGAAANPVERARFLADKDALMDRIGDASSRAEPRPPLRGRDNQQAAAAADDALDDAVQARAELGGYALVGPSARTWRTDPDTGRLLEPVSEAEHRTLRQLLAVERFTTAPPAWLATPHGTDIVSTVHTPPDHLADDLTDDLGADDTIDEVTDKAAQGWAADDSTQAWASAGASDAAPPHADDAGERQDDRSSDLGLTGGEGPHLDAGPALSAEEAAHELAADGRSLDEARSMVRGYLDNVSEQVGTSVHLWGLDDADLAAIRADPIERARTAVAVLGAASDDTDAPAADAELVDEDGWSR